MSYLDRLLAIIAQESEGEAPSKPSKPRSAPPREGIEGFEGFPTRPFSGNGSLAAATGPGQWQAALASLDAATTPEGFSPARWRELVEDARWLAERHGPSASALGWSASDLFGLDEQLDRWGGLADRLAGARRATFTDTVARWRSDTQDGWLWRRTLRPMRLLWQVPMKF